jgi:hypothetical protein
MSHRTSSLARKAAAVTAGAVVCAFGAGVGEAAAATTIDPLPASAPLVQKLYVPLSITVACDPPVDFWTSIVGNVAIRQVVRNKEVAHSSMWLPPLTCDGAAHAYDVNLFPDAGTATAPPSVPFKKGDAVISVDVGNIYDSSAQHAWVGPQTIRLS